MRCGIIICTTNRQRGTSHARRGRQSLIASTIGRPCLTNIACLADAPSNLIVPPMRNKRLSRTRPRSIVALPIPCILRYPLVSVLAGQCDHSTAYPAIFPSCCERGIVMLSFCGLRLGLEVVRNAILTSLEGAHRLVTVRDPSAWPCCQVITVSTHTI